MNTLSDLQAIGGIVFRERLPQSATPRSLLLMLHGVGSNERNIASLADGADEGTLVIVPRGRLEIGHDQFAWFPVVFTTNGPRIEAAQAEQSRLALIALIRALQKQHGIAPQRTVIAGFSQGGIMSASVGLTAPECVAGFGLLSGRILPEIGPAIATREQLASLRGFVGHGLYDNKLPVDWAHQAQALLDRIGVTHELRLYEHGHEAGAIMQHDFSRWLREITHAAN